MAKAVTHVGITEGYDVLVDVSRVQQNHSPDQGYELSYDFFQNYHNELNRCLVTLLHIEPSKKEIFSQ